MPKDTTNAKELGDYVAAGLRKYKRTDLQGSGLAKAITKLFLDFTAVEKAPCATNVIPPDPQSVTEYFASIDWPIDGQEFCDAYEQKGWKVGNNPMKSWQAACRTWKREGWGKLITTQNNPQPSKDWTDPFA